MPQKAILTFSRENSRLLLQDRSHRGYLSLNICQTAKAAAQRNMTGTHGTKNPLLLRLSQVDSIFCIFLAAWTQTAVQSATVAVDTDQRADCCQCCLFTLVAPDWVRVPGNETACMCVNAICFWALQLAFLKSNRWTSAEGDTRNSLHLLGRLCVHVQPRGIGHLLVIYPRAAGGCSFTSELSWGIRKL